VARSIWTIRSRPPHPSIRRLRDTEHRGLRVLAGPLAGQVSYFQADNHEIDVSVSLPSARDVPGTVACGHQA